MCGHCIRSSRLPAAAAMAVLTVLGAGAVAFAVPFSPAAAHPVHEVKAWSARYRGRVFHVVQLPRCEHLEAVITHDPSGETKERAERRVGGVAVMSGSFHHPRTLSLADFLQRQGTIESGATTGRWFLAILADGGMDISGNYAAYKGKSGISAMALGQRLVPFHRDGFSTSFMNRTTPRMALGLSRDHIYLVTATTDIWRLAAFMRTKLPVGVAINSDGGHVVSGRAPVHLVFRWRKSPAPAALKLASHPAESARTGGAPVKAPRIGKQHAASTSPGKRVAG